MPGSVIPPTSQEQLHRVGLTDRRPSELDVTVVICAYTERRWEQTRAAVQSVLAQRPMPAEVLLVIDHNAALAAHARQDGSLVAVLENDEARGLSGARNTALRAATQPVIVFLDDDAEAREGWLAALTEPYSRLEVVATGGSVHPRWPTSRPRWLPHAFDWVVGCSYLGLPRTTESVRNPIGANMSVRTRAALDVGGFNVSVGRVGIKPQGCEETELAIRLTANHPGAAILYVPDAAVDHHVAQDRLTLRYFLRRCWHEGLSKATVVRLTSAAAGLERERRQVAVVIPVSLLGDLRELVTGDAAGLARMITAIGGLATTAAGYITGRVRSIGRSPVP
jgi:GT2 family glycosyltransferase